MDRLFVALPLAGPARAAIRAHLARCLPGGLPGRVVPPENWHLTLRFLGDSAPEARDRVVRELETAPLGPPFEMVFGAAGAFPRPARATTLWLGVEGGGERLAAAAAAVEEAARRAGYPPESRPFAPHLTLSRLRPPADLRPVLAAIPAAGISAAATEVVLYRSELGGGPPRYAPVARLPLR